jgi:tRNA (guanine37-N1)-methyltransferase
MSPSWDLLNQEKVENYYKSFENKDIIIICGHYEWIDQRIIEKYVDYEISIWEYVLTSGELSASILIDSLVRHIPDVLWNPQSLKEESFSKFFDRQKEHPVYTRPQIFEDMKVPEILTSGNHKKIEQWKQNNTKN